MTDKPGPRFTKEAVAEIKARVDCVALIGRSVALKKRGGRHWGLCPFHAEKTPSFTVARHSFKCFGCGASGTAIDFVMQAERIPFADAVERLASGAGVEISARPIPKPKPQPRSQSWRAIWDRAAPAAGTLVETYWRSRGIRALVPSTKFRFVAALEYWHEAEAAKRPEILCRAPAQVAAVQGPTGALVGLHITYLAADGAGKARIADPDAPGEFLAAKKMRGDMWQGAIRLAPAGPRLAVAEGIETGLSVLEALGGAVPVWVAGSLDNLAGGAKGRGRPHPEKPAPARLPSEWPDMERPGLVLPDLAREILILADNDSKDPRHARALVTRAARRWQNERRTVQVAWPPEGKDFNDVKIDVAGAGVTQKGKAA